MKRCVVCNRLLGYDGKHACPPKTLVRRDREERRADDAQPDPEPSEPEKIVEGLDEVFGPNGEYG